MKNLQGVQFEFCKKWHGQLYTISGAVLQSLLFTLGTSMKTSQYLLATLKETPADAEIVSHQLMLRAGMIRRLGSGLYSWLPLGLRVLQKVTNVVREEMTRSGALEILMPSIQPAELWEESQRWEEYGPLLLKIKDRQQRDFCYGPTHEEVITDLMRKELRSYKQLPINLFQIQTKFRDEIRPRFGVMRAREFIMKDAYSFHLTDASLKETYQVMYDTYSRIFTRLGLHFKPVLADTGSIGGSYSHEFQVLAETGEDVIVYSTESDYVANMELAYALPPQGARPAAGPAMELVKTPGQTTIAMVSDYLKTSPQQSVKTLIVKGAEHPLVALVLRGDHELNELKAEKHPLVFSPLTFATDAEIVAACGTQPGSLGPVNIDIPVLVDPEAAHLANFICGANQDDHHFINVNWVRDCKEPDVFDMRNVVEGDASPDGKGTLAFARGIEVGHIFQLGRKYSQAMKASVLDEQGKAVEMYMGCYGIGVSRILGAAIEQNHDERGILWPEAMTPFQVAIIPIGKGATETAEELYQQFLAQGIEVLLDDRDERPGVKFADMDLIGIPHRIVVGERNLEKGLVEYKRRTENEAILLPKEEVLNHCRKS